jgi:predicted DNA-binding ribbon-helix-helix protein
MKSPVIKRSIVIAGHKTSVSLEDAFWKGLKDIAVSRQLTLSDLVATIDTGRPRGNLSSAIRLFVLNYYQARTNGHGEVDQPDHDIMIAPAVAASVLRPE